MYFVCTSATRLLITSEFGIPSPSVSLAHIIFPSVDSTAVYTPLHCMYTMRREDTHTLHHVNYTLYTYINIDSGVWDVASHVVDNLNHVATYESNLYGSHYNRQLTRRGTVYRDRESWHSQVLCRTAASSPKHLTVSEYHGKIWGNCMCLWICKE